MIRIGLMSDTHGYLDPAIAIHFANCDEVWHAGDFGHIELVNELRNMLPLANVFRGVYGNIDGSDIRGVYKEQEFFKCEGVTVLMRHIGGYPPKYNATVKSEIAKLNPTLFISGHSHILRIMYDDKAACLYMNPGACGRTGWHKVRTLIRFEIDGSNIKNCEVVELGSRAS